VEVSVSQARDEVDKLNGKASAWKLAGYPSAENPFKKEEPPSNDVPLFSELGVDNGENNGENMARLMTGCWRN